MTAVVGDMRGTNLPVERVSNKSRRSFLERFVILLASFNSKEFSVRGNGFVSLG